MTELDWRALCQFLRNERDNYRNGSDVATGATWRVLDSLASVSEKMADRAAQETK